MFLMYHPRQNRTIMQSPKNLDNYITMSDGRVQVRVELSIGPIGSGWEHSLVLMMLTIKFSLISNDAGSLLV